MSNATLSIAPKPSPAAALKVESFTSRKWLVDGKEEASEATPGMFAIVECYGQKFTRAKLLRMHAALGALLTDTAGDPEAPSDEG